MAFKRLEKKGIPRFLVDERLSEGRLSIHRSTLPPGASSHDPHTHGGVEAFVIVKGPATLEVDGQTEELREMEAMVVDAEVPHTIHNRSGDEIEYIVIQSSEGTP